MWTPGKDTAARLTRPLACAACWLAASSVWAQTEPRPVTLPAPDTPVSEVTLIAFDTETTGLSPKSDRIVEIGITPFTQGQPAGSVSWLVNPGREIPAYATKVHGITDAMVAGQPSFKDVYPRFTEAAGDAALLAHNATFDIRFITAEVARNGLDQPRNQVIDTLKLFRAWYPDAPSHNLAQLADYVGVEIDSMHRAEADATLLLRILRKGLETRGPEMTWGDLLRDAGGLMRFGP